MAEYEPEANNAPGFSNPTKSKPMDRMGKQDGSIESVADVHTSARAPLEGDWVGSVGDAEIRPPVFVPVTEAEVEAAYERLLEKGREKTRLAAAFRAIDGLTDPARVSLRPVGCDGMTTRQVERSADAKRRFFSEIVRMFNEDRPGTTLPKFRLKRFKVQVRRESRDGKEKERRTVVLCLRDQVAVRVLLGRLTTALSVGERWNQVYATVEGLVRDIRGRSTPPLIIKTDISQFHPSVDRTRLLEMLRAKGVLDGRTMDILEQVLCGHPSADEVAGLPMGLSVSVLLGEFYAASMQLDGMLPGVRVHRFADDIVLVAESGTESAHILRALDDRMAALGLSRNADKTVVVEGGRFEFLGVQFDGRRVWHDETRVKRWEAAVWTEVGRDIRSHQVMAGLDPARTIPDRREVARAAFREHKRGERSAYWRYMQRLRALDAEEVSITHQPAA